MSWSISCLGKPENICAELDNYCSSLSGQSKVEFDDAKEAIKTLVKQNFGSTSLPHLIELTANGSGATNGTEQLSRSCTVSIKSCYMKVV